MSPASSGQIRLSPSPPRHRPAAREVQTPSRPRQSADPYHRGHDVATVTIAATSSVRGTRSCDRSACGLRTPIEAASLRRVPDANEARSIPAPKYHGLLEPDVSPWDATPQSTIQKIHRMREDRGAGLPSRTSSSSETGDPEIVLEPIYQAASAAIDVRDLHVSHASALSDPGMQCDDRSVRSRAGPAMWGPARIAIPAVDAYRLPSSERLL
jgi:hypothetical protein